MILDRVDMNQTVSLQEYEKLLPELQLLLREQSLALYQSRIPVVIVYEGWDAAGKGGNIRRVIEKLDPRAFKVMGVKAPTDEELAHHYLWRFWRHIPKGGHITIYDRSWYGRVLVERVEGFCEEHEWRRSYQEINEFEENLYNFGTVVLKFWLQISSDEQLKRFQEREQNPFKRWKITDEDWRNRDKWDVYEPAVTDMLTKTSTGYAPWNIIAANDKLYARVRTLQIITGTIEHRLRSKHKGS